MLALATSLLVAGLLILPELLQRVIIGLFIPLRTIDRGRSEQLARALFSVFIPLVLTVWLVSKIRFLHHLVFFQYTQLADKSPRGDLKILFYGLVSDDVFKRSSNEFFQALGRTWHSAWPVIVTFYGICCAIAVLIGVATIRYGAIREWSIKRQDARWPLSWLNRFITFFMKKALLERVSFWHALLTPFTIADKSAVITLDVLVSNGLLYQGTYLQHLLDGEAKLAGIVLSNPRRFLRDEYAKERSAGTAALKKEDFWKPIPSKSLFIPGNSIVNLNVNYETKQALTRYVSKEIASEQFEISIEP